MTEMQQNTKKKVEIDFMYIDLEVCTRCMGTDDNLDKALQTVRSVLEAAGAEVTVRKTLIDSESKALELEFVSSPTIRVNGQDVALELRESVCESCGEASGGDQPVDCRVWVYQGKEYTVAPVPMIVDAILAATYGAQAGQPVPRTAESVPENLKRFFAAKASNATSSCCSTQAQTSCCEPAQKSTCCSPAAEVAQPSGCGCR